MVSIKVEPVLEISRIFGKILMNFSAEKQLKERKVKREEMSLYLSKYLSWKQ
jgi:hypothetical protein